MSDDSRRNSGEERQSEQWEAADEELLDALHQGLLESTELGTYYPELGDELIEDFEATRSLHSFLQSSESESGRHSYYCAQCDEMVEVVVKDETPACARCRRPFPRTLEAPGQPDSDNAAKWGRYEVQCFLDRGSFGKVFMAYDVVLKRLVAIKLLDPRVTSGNFERLLHEARAAAQLDHPNIVPVYDVILAGRKHGIVLGYVEGISLKDLLQANSFHALRAARMIHDCALALNYAHQRGVVHRDIKPANIMLEADIDHHIEVVDDWLSVTAHDSGVQLRPRLLDFGLALLQSEQSPQKVIRAEGTPRYRSPEQWQGQPGDERSDIYSLGVVFYEMVFGVLPPLQQLLLESRGVTDTSVNGSPPEPGDVAAELHAICTKAMRRSPAERFQTAAEFAEELQRWLRDEPIHCYWQNPLRRLVLRSRRDFWSIAAVCILFLGLVATGIFWYRADSHYRRAEQLRVSESAAKGDAEESLGWANDAIETMLTDVSQERLLNLPHMQPIRKQLLLQAKEFYKKIVQARQDSDEPTLELGKAFHRLAFLSKQLGESAEAVGQYEEACRVFSSFDDEIGRLNLAKSLTNLGVVYFENGDREKGIHAVQDALNHKLRLFEESPDNTEYEQLVAGSHNDLGELQRRIGEDEQAEQSFLQVIAILQKLVDDDTAARINSPKKEEKALQEYRYYTLAKAYNNLGVMLLGLSDRQEEAMPIIQRSLGTLERFSTFDSEQLATIDYKEVWGVTQNTLGYALAVKGDLDEAASAFEAAGKVYEKLARDHPDVPDFARRVGVWYSNVSEVYLLKGDLEKAKKECLQAIEVRKELANKYPDDPVQSTNLGRSYSFMGDLLIRDADFLFALRYYQLADQVFSESLERGPQLESAKKFSESVAEKRWQIISLLLPKAPL